MWYKVYNGTATRKKVYSIQVDTKRAKKALSQNTDIHIFRLQKRVVRIITGVGNRDSCRELFKNLKILTLVSQYIYSVVIFIIENRNDYICN
jgi:hypothetical protein